MHQFRTVPDFGGRSEPIQTPAWQTPALLGGSLCVFFVLLYVFWLGYIGSDDTNYWRNAGQWLTHFPVVGNDHFAARWPLVLPIAVFRRALGDVPAALVLPTLLYAVGLIAVLVVWLRKRAGLAAALAGAAFIVTNAQLVADSSTATIDITEAFFVCCALFAFDEAAENGSNSALFIGGLALGCGILSRETTGFVVVAFCILFLLGFALSRRRYFLFGAGFAAIEVAEAAFYWIYSGDPFHRWRIDANHDLHIDRWIDQGAGVPLIHPLVDPFTMVLLNHYFGLIAWIGVPLAIWLLLRNNLDRPVRRAAVLVGFVAAVWGLLAAGLWHELTLIPRYFFFPGLAVSFLASIAVGQLWKAGRQALAITLSALLVAGNLLGLIVDNRNFMFGEHELVALANSNDQTIHTDKATFTRSALLLEWDKIGNRVTDAPPKPGDLFLLNPPEAKEAVSPSKDWTVLARLKPQPPFALALVMKALPRVLPSRIITRFTGHPGVTLYRVEP